MTAAGSDRLIMLYGTLRREAVRRELGLLGRLRRIGRCRLAGILHGIKGRLARGTAASAHAADMVARLEPLAELAWAQALKAGAR